MMDIMTVVRPAATPEYAGGREGYEVDPAAAYPAAVADIRQVLAAGLDGMLREVKTPSADVFRGLYRRAKRLPPEAWAAALVHKSTVVPEQHADRTEALTIARLWFTELLHMQIGYGPLYVHILKDMSDTYRL